MKRNIWTWVLDLLYPPRCLLCHRFLEPTEQPVCRRCMDALPEFEGAPIQVPGAEDCAVTFFYEGTLRESFLRFKFEGRKWYASQYGAWLAVSIRDRLCGKYDLLTWVPVSRERKRERGYDQAELLCRAVGKTLGMEPCVTLEKTVHNPAQSGLSDAAQRKENTKGVYRAISPEGVRGKRILLIDDIVTTGATLSECVRVLKEAGAARVVCAALATPRKT